jgi:hypothetical protein
MAGRSDHQYDAENCALWLWYHAGLYELRRMLSAQIHDDMRARFDEGARLTAK